MYSSDSIRAIATAVFCISPFTYNSAFTPTYIPFSPQESSSTLKKESTIQIVQNKRVQRLRELSNLKQGWDGYNAHPIPRSVITRVHDILLMEELPLNAEVIPTGRSSIQIELNLDNSNYFELEVFPKRYSVYIEKDGQEVEKDIQKKDIKQILSQFCHEH